MNGIEISVPFTDGMSTLFIPWQGLVVLILVVVGVVATVVGVVHLMNGRRREHH